MPTVYSASSSNWPLLQSKTEQKYKSGLFNVSAEFIRPVGNTTLPTQIETSIGNVSVWPDPTVSVGTDGFERINATGYGIYDNTKVEEKISLVPLSLDILAVTFNNCNGQSLFSEKRKSIKIFGQNVYKHVPGQNIPLTPEIRLFSNNGIDDITEVEYNVTSLFGITQSDYSGDFTSKKAIFSCFIENIKTNDYGDVKTTEVVFNITIPTLNFGNFDKICSPPP